MRAFAVLLCVFGALAAGSDRGLAAEAYRIGAGDALGVSVWEHPDLTRQVVVGGTGSITFPPIGEIPAAGETAESLARVIEQRLYDFLRRPTQVTVEIAAFNSQRVTVSGAVTAPGRMSFERIPGILEVLGSAGGLGPAGDLSHVQIFRTEGEKLTSITVDLTTAMRTGDLANLPKLRAGDVVYVPNVGTEVGGGPAMAYVGGQVARPGAYPVGPGLDLEKLMSLAGGALPDGDLRQVQVLGNATLGGGPFVATVNLEQYIESGQGGFLVKPGDSVRVPPKSDRPAVAALNVAQNVLAVSRDVLNLFLIRSVLKQ